MDKYEIVIKPTTGFLRLDLKAVWQYRDLLGLLVHRDFVSKYKQTVLGPVWFVLQPLLTTLVFTLIFSGVAKIPTDGLPPALFYMCGLLGWSYFAQTFTSTSATLVVNAGLFGKVYFPRLVVPLSAVIANMMAFCLQLATFLGFYIYYKLFTPLGTGFGVSGSLVWLPLLLLQIGALSLGVGLCLSAVTAKYRDFTFLTPFIVQLWMYATPVIYPLSKIPERWHWLAVLNPMAAIVEAFRLMFLGRGSVAPAYAAVSAAITAAVLLTGLLIFNKVQKTFVDTI
jgi:lipopolysaccharide transport system permease protein